MLRGRRDWLSTHLDDRQGLCGLRLSAKRCHGLRTQRDRARLMAHGGAGSGLQVAKQGAQHRAARITPCPQIGLCVEAPSVERQAAVDPPLAFALAAG